MSRKLYIQPFKSLHGNGEVAGPTCLSLKGNQGFSEQLFNFVDSLHAKHSPDEQEEAEIMFTSEHDAKIYFGKTSFNLHFSVANPMEVYEISEDKLHYIADVNGHLNVMNTTENISFASKITTGVKRSSSSIVQQEEIGGLETTTVTISTSSHHIESKLAASITQQGPIKKKAKPELSAAKPIPQGTPSTASNTNSGRLRVQALSSVVRLEVPLEVTKSSISNFFNNLKIQHIYALAHSKEIGKYSVYVKFETISGAELALEQSMETLKFVVGQSISSVEAVVESVGKLEAILVCGMCLRMRSKDSSGKTLNELMSRDYMTAFQPLFCIELLSSYEHFVEQYNSVNLCSEAMSANQFAEVLQSQFDFKNVGVNDWIASQLLQPTLFSFHAIGSSSSLLEIQSVLEKMKEKLIGFWNCRAVLEKIKTDELAVSDFELIECVTQSIHLHETLFALFWRVMINDQLPEL